MDESSLLFDLKQHFWVREDDQICYFGITDFAQDQLGDILFVDLPELDEYKSGEYVLSLESGKKEQELFAPFDMEIVEVNGDLEDSPELINTAPYENWIFGARVNKDNLKILGSETEYGDSIKK